MQFLTVHAQDRASGKVLTNIPVLINGECNGTTGNMLKLDGGLVEISADYHLADTKVLNLKNTTYEFPMSVMISVGSELNPQVPNV